MERSRIAQFLGFQGRGGISFGSGLSFGRDGRNCKLTRYRIPTIIIVIGLMVIPMFCSPNGEFGGEAPLPTRAAARDVLYSLPLVAALPPFISLRPLRSLRLKKLRRLRQPRSSGAEVLFCERGCPSYQQCGRGLPRAGGSSGYSCERGISYYRQ